MNARIHWTNRLLNRLSNISKLADGTVYAIPIDANVQNILTASFSYQVNDYYAQLKYYAYYDNSSKLLDDVEASGVDIEHLEKLGAWKPLIVQSVPAANTALLANYVAASLIANAGHTSIADTTHPAEHSFLSTPHR